jgi:hypothetical protein
MQKLTRFLSGPGGKIIFVGDIAGGLCASCRDRGIAYLSVLGTLGVSL